MSYQASKDTINRLRWHAGLRQSAGQGDISISDCAGATSNSDRLDDDLRTTDAAWAVETTWSAVLAGDFDDLAEHLRHEHPARRR